MTINLKNKPAVFPFDFRSEGPPLSRCDLCDQRFKCGWLPTRNGPSPLRNTRVSFCA